MTELRDFVIKMFNLSLLRYWLSNEMWKHLIGLLSSHELRSISLIRWSTEMKSMFLFSNKIQCKVTNRDLYSAIWRGRKPLNQCQCSFKMKAALPLANQQSLADSKRISHYSDVIMTTMAFQITSLAVVYSIVYSSAYQRKHQNSASLAFVRGIHRWPVNSPHKGPVTRKKLPFDVVVML